MRNLAIGLTVGVCVAAVASADGSPSILSRVKTLERQVKKLEHRKARTRVFGTSRPLKAFPPNTDYFHREVSCPEGKVATGGGVQWIGLTTDPRDRIVESYPTSLGWVATTYSPARDGALVYVRCV